MRSDLLTLRQCRHSAFGNSLNFTSSPKNENFICTIKCLKIQTFKIIILHAV